MVQLDKMCRREFFQKEGFLLDKLFHITVDILPHENAFQCHFLRHLACSLEPLVNEFHKIDLTKAAGSQFFNRHEVTQLKLL